LIELLVVVLMLGILAAIALPSFLGQTRKATNAQAKALVRLGETTAETIATDNNGQYGTVSPAELNRVEPSVQIAASATQAYVSSATGNEHEYSVTAKAVGGDEFTIRRGAAGEVTRACTSPITKTGCSGGETGSW
jgi:type IV pilus assembly protein PilA